MSRCRRYSLKPCVEGTWRKHKTTNQADGCFHLFAIVKSSHMYAFCALVARILKFSDSCEKRAEMATFLHTLFITLSYLQRYFTNTSRIRKRFSDESGIKSVPSPGAKIFIAPESSFAGTCKGHNRDLHAILGGFYVFVRHWLSYERARNWSSIM